MTDASDTHSDYIKWQYQRWRITRQWSARREEAWWQRQWAAVVAKRRRATGWLFFLISFLLTIVTKDNVENGIARGRIWISSERYIAAALSCAWESLKSLGGIRGPGELRYDSAMMTWNRFSLSVRLNSRCHSRSSRVMVIEPRSCFGRNLDRGGGPAVTVEWECIAIKGQSTDAISRSNFRNLCLILSRLLLFQLKRQLRANYSFFFYYIDFNFIANNFFKFIVSHTRKYL